MKFRKKPVVIDAVQLLNDQPIPPGVNFGYPCAEGETHALQNKFWVATLEGPLVAQLGDWIIKGVKGEFYPCKPDIFAATYEPLDEGL